MKNVLVTGATGEIGCAIAEAFAEAGNNVAVHTNSRAAEAAELSSRLAEKYGIDSVSVVADLSDEKQVNDMFFALEKKWGHVQVLINNAGISMVGMLCDTTEKEWSRLHDVNLKSVFLCSKAASENMVHNKWGRIINISSVWGQVGASCEVAYSSSKAAVIGFTKALARELAPSGITVNCICPGMIDTKMNSHLSEEEKKDICSEIPVGRMGRPAEVAHAAVFLADEKSSYITAEVLGVNGGWI